MDKKCYHRSPLTVLVSFHAFSLWLTLWETIWKSPSQIENCFFNLINLINLIKLNHLNSPHARHVNTVGDPLKKPQSNWKLPFQFDQFDQIEPIWTALKQDTLTLWETIWKSRSQIENCRFNLIKLNHLNSPHARHVNTVGDHLKKPESNWKLLFQFDQFDQIEPFEQPSRVVIYRGFKVILIRF